MSASIGSPSAAPGDAQPLGAGSIAAIVVAAHRMARRDDRQQAGMRGGDQAVRAAAAISSSPGWVLAASQTGRAADRPAQLGERVGIGRQAARPRP